MVLALEIQNLKKTYGNGVEALKGVSLSVPAGDFFALLGPNGAGKTSIIGTILGLVTKTEGSVHVFGTNIDENPEVARRFVGIVPQENNLNIFEKVIDIVVNQAGYYGIPRRIALPRAEKILRDVGLYERRYEMTRNLSGGMKRRLMIARALVHEPKFLILDEPTAGVDVELRRGMWTYLKTLTKEGLTILLTTHYLEEAEHLAKNIAILHNGEIVKTGTIQEILGSLKTETITLDLAAPHTEATLTALASYKPKKIDATTIEIETSEGMGVGGAVVALHAQGISVRAVAPKNGRLEEVFVRLTSRKY
ncbi:MAG: hypothetical protein A3D67_00360 [Candidatus Lloydbacteria bacterium RIFCSPHIGHO2_02_FULL_51_22]|uniref:ABC transporter domain-containing protein n=1 Tax=Candidatus Lloydbacteria bacterium RIFCSPHIGHO2_02_FULL_51_22 TaxID=1798663 RepID=A0A1G2DGG7_9BACT|nr:MAG: hypothetical protein A3D67_00360 [Candidatus Lloydbacteria bacterium RIFCSPHIGHO2_02_FULL_51_22]